MADNRVQIIKSIDKPINFLVLILLMVEALLGGMAFKFEAQREFLIYVIIIFFAVYTVVVILIAFFKPEALQGSRNWTQRYAQPMADDLYMSLEGYLSNLEEGEENEAWIQLMDVLNSSNAEDNDFKKFSATVAKRLATKLDFKRNIAERRGTIN